ncbi:hypothetical protein MA11_gp33 [Pectobacterium phage MA11]|uniref:hypothetical protein n=1 Tax=Pectobacterium phage MA11 TaxID=2662283 RepID=UPI0012A86C7D|nr:hypothetical protein JT356_gp33 [Pectobacterium phage MA11]QGF21056.1 hypothetical protein MA11_gp33 [Pectobacterium phage MA11]
MVSPFSVNTCRVSCPHDWHGPSQVNASSCRRGSGSGAHLIGSTLPVLMVFLLPHHSRHLPSTNRHSTQAVPLRRYLRSSASNPYVWVRIRMQVPSVGAVAMS